MLRGKRNFNLLPDKTKLAIVVHDADSQVHFCMLVILVPVPQLALKSKSAGGRIEREVPGRIVKVVVFGLEGAILVGVVIVEIDLGHVVLAVVAKDETAQNAAVEVEEGASLQNGLVPVQ